jgi:hypothetical protein
MAAKKKTAKMEPLLNTLARKLGHAAGKLTLATHHLTENLSETGTVTGSNSPVTGTDAPSKRFRTRGRGAKPKTPRTRISPRPSTRKAKKATKMEKPMQTPTSRRSTPHRRSLKRR